MARRRSTDNTPATVWATRADVVGALRLPNSSLLTRNGVPFGSNLIERRCSRGLASVETPARQAVQPNSATT